LLPTLFDSNVFIALNREYSLAEAMSSAREILKESKRLGFAPFVLPCVLDEIHQHELRNEVHSLCEVAKVPDDLGSEMVSKVRLPLTREGKLTDYKLIAAGVFMNDERPLLVSDDYLLRDEYSRHVTRGDIMTPYRFTEVLDEKSPSPVMKDITERLRRHFLGARGPESLVARGELRQQAETRAGEKPSGGLAGAVARYLAGGGLTGTERSALSGVLPFIRRVREFDRSEDPLGEIEGMLGELSSSDKSQATLGDLRPALKRLGEEIAAKGEDMEAAGDLPSALRCMNFASTLLSLSCDELDSFLVKTNCRRALLQLVLQNRRQASRILDAIVPNLGEGRDADAVWCTLGVAKILSGDQQGAVHWLEKMSMAYQKAVREFGDLFYHQRLYEEAIGVYRFLAQNGYMDDEMSDSLQRTAGIIGVELEDSIISMIPVEKRREDHTRHSMPYLTKDYGMEWSDLQETHTPKYFRDPMKIRRIHNLPKRTLLVVWNEGIQSRLGLNITGAEDLRNADSIRLNAGPAKMKNTIHRALYNIRGEIETNESTEFEIFRTAGRLIPGSGAE
jgi:hypothetical protein